MCICLLVTWELLYKQDLLCWARVRILFFASLPEKQTLGRYPLEGRCTYWRSATLFSWISVWNQETYSLSSFFHFNIYVEHVFTRRGKKLEASDCSYWSLKTGLAVQHQQPIFTYLKLASQSHSGWQESRHQQTHSLSVPILSWLDYRLFAWSHATAASCIDHRWWLAAGERPAASAASARWRWGSPSHLSFPLYTSSPPKSSNFFQIWRGFVGWTAWTAISSETLEDQNILINQSWEEEEGYWRRLLICLSAPTTVRENWNCCRRQPKFL